MLRRGFIYLKNNKKRGLLLTGILFVMAMFLFVGGDLRKAAGEELKTVQKQMGGSIQVKADTENQATASESHSRSREAAHTPPPARRPEHTDSAISHRSEIACNAHQTP